MYFFQNNVSNVELMGMKFGMHNQDVNVCCVPKYFLDIFIKKYRSFKNFGYFNCPIFICNYLTLAKF